MESTGIPVQGARVTLYSTQVNRGRRALASTVSGNDGHFRLSYRLPETRGPLVLTTGGGQLADRGRPVPRQYVLATVVAQPAPGQRVTLNELSTVAAAFALAQFIDGHRISGKEPGLTLAARMTRNLVDIESGEPGATISNDDNNPSSDFSSLKVLNEMANLVAGCATNAGVCRTMMNLALPLHGPAPSDTFRALANMARNPWRNPVPLFNLVASEYYQPDLLSTPLSAWALALKFKGDPVQLAGPGNVAFDSDGQMWILNNLVTDETYVLPDCGSQLLFRMDPATGKVATFSGGGVIGAGYGIGIAPKNNDIWVGNFGFKGTTCFGDLANNSVSQFSAGGVALSPDATEFDLFGNPQNGGWTQGGIGWPQGTVSNRHGDIWIVSCGGQTTPLGQVDVTVYRHGNPNDFFVIRDRNLTKPFDIAFDKRGTAWVSGTMSNNLMAFDADGR